jgi:hypothetical protein
VNNDQANKTLPHANIITLNDMIAHEKSRLA